MGILFADREGEIYAVRRESPLIVGVAEDESFIASDVPAIIQYTKNYYLLEHDEIAKLTAEGVTFTDLEGVEIEKELNIE